jgi:hypothetical protein
MNARFVAGLAVAAIPIMSLLGAASASADINKRCTAPISATDTAASTGPMPGICTVGKYNNTVGKYDDPPPSVTKVRADPHSVVRLADMAVLPRRRQRDLRTVPRSSSLTETGPGSPSARTRGLPVLVSNRSFPLCWGC